MSINEKYAPLLTGVIMALFTTSFATFLAVTINYRWRAGFFFPWLKTYRLPRRDAVHPSRLPTRAEARQLVDERLASDLIIVCGG